MKFKGIKIRFSITDLLLVYLIITVVVAHTLPILRVVLYSIFPFFVLLSSLNSKKPFSIKLLFPEYRIVFVWLVPVLLINLINFGDYNFSFMIKETIFLTLGLVTPYVLVVNIKNRNQYLSLEFLFIIYVILFFGLSILNGRTVSINLINQLRNSVSTFESVSSFIFGLFSSIFLLKKRYFFFLIAVVVTLLTSKRIAIAGIGACGFLMYFYELLRVSEKGNVGNILSCLAVLCNLLFLWSFYYLSTGVFDNWFIENLGISPNYLFMGRVNLIGGVFKHIGELPFFGYGIGFTTYLLQDGILASKAHLGLLHSDIIKFYIELGIIPFSLILFMIYQISSRSKTSFCLLVYMNVLMLTDNISIYIGIMIFFYLLYSDSLLTRRELVQSRNTIAN